MTGWWRCCGERSRELRDVSYELRAVRFSGRLAAAFFFPCATGGNQLCHLGWSIRAWIRGPLGRRVYILANFLVFVGWIDRFSIWCLLFWFPMGQK